MCGAVVAEDEGAARDAVLGIFCVISAFYSTPVTQNAETTQKVPSSADARGTTGHYMTSSSQTPSFCL